VIYSGNKDGDENKNCHYRLSNLYKRFHYEAHVLENPPVTSPWKPRALWNTEYTYMVLTIITSNFNRKSTTMYTKRKMAKARSGVLELLLPPPTAAQLGFQVINEFMFYTD